MRTFVTDRRTDGQTSEDDGAGFIRTRGRVLTSKYGMDPPKRKPFRNKMIALRIEKNKTAWLSEARCADQGVSSSSSINVLTDP